MPYISKEQVSKIRKAIKAAYPKFKFSIRKDGYSSVYVTMKSGPMDMGPLFEHVDKKAARENRNVVECGRVARRYAKINQYWLNDYDGLGEITKLIRTIIGIMMEDYRIVSEDGDYGSIPNYYVHFSIGDYDAPYVKI